MVWFDLLEKETAAEFHTFSFSSDFFSNVNGKALYNVEVKNRIWPCFWQQHHPACIGFEH